MSITKRSALVSLAGLAGYFLIPLLAMATSGASWDGNGPRFEENALGDAAFWLMMAAFGVFVLAAVVTAVSAIIRWVRPRASHG